MKSLGLASVKSSATLFIHRISLNRKNLHLFYLNFCIFLKYNMKNQTHNYRGFIKGSIWSVFGTAALLSVKSQSESAKYSMGYNKAIFNQQQLWTYSKWSTASVIIKGTLFAYFLFITHIAYIWITFFFHIVCFIWYFVLNILFHSHFCCDS